MVELIVLAELGHGIYESMRNFAFAIERNTRETESLVAVPLGALRKCKLARRVVFTAINPGAEIGSSQRVGLEEETPNDWHSILWRIAGSGPCDDSTKLHQVGIVCLAGSVGARECQKCERVPSLSFDAARILIKEPPLLGTRFKNCN